MHPNTRRAARTRISAVANYARWAPIDGDGGKHRPVYEKKDLKALTPKERRYFLEVASSLDLFLQAKRELEYQVEEMDSEVDL